MNCDICWCCDGTGMRDVLSGAPCHECNGTGWKEELDTEDMTDEELDDYERAMDEFYTQEDEQSHSSFDVTDGRWQYPNGSPP